MFYRNFAKFTRKHLCQSFFFNKIAGLRLATLLKKRIWHRCFPVSFVKFIGTLIFIEHLWWLLLKPIATLFSIRKASRNRVPCFYSLFLTKLKVFINVSGGIRKSTLNCCIMARSFLLFHICWNRSFSRQKVQTFLSASKSMIDNAIFKLCEQKNIFLSSIDLRITVFARFLAIINKLPEQQKKYFFPYCCVFFHFNCFYILHFDLLYRYIQVVKVPLFTLKISFLLFFHNLLFQHILISLAGKKCSQRVLLHI